MPNPAAGLAVPYVRTPVTGRRAKRRACAPESRSWPWPRPCSSMPPSSPSSSSSSTGTERLGEPAGYELAPSEAPRRRSTGSESERCVLRTSLRGSASFVGTRTGVGRESSLLRRRPLRGRTCSVGKGGLRSQPRQRYSPISAVLGPSGRESCGMAAARSCLLAEKMSHLRPVCGGQHPAAGDTARDGGAPGRGAHRDRLRPCGLQPPPARARGAPCRVGLSTRRCGAAQSERRERRDSNPRPPA